MKRIKQFLYRLKVEYHKHKRWGKENKMVSKQYMYECNLEVTKKSKKYDNLAIHPKIYLDKVWKVRFGILNLKSKEIFEYITSLESVMEILNKELIIPNKQKWVKIKGE